jgi:heterodisulfide reductase subunit C
MMNAVTLEVERWEGDLAQEVKLRSGASPMNCFQCRKCSSGCPVASRADLKPHEVVRLVQMDQSAEVLASRFIWECTSCLTCAARCPQNVNIAAMNDALRAISRAQAKTVDTTTVPFFNDAFLDAIRKRGRIYEIGLMAAFKLHTMRLFDDVGKVPTMLLKGKLPLFGPRIRGRAERQAMFRRATQGDDK